MATVVRKDTLQPWRGERLLNGTALPPNIGDLWSDAELAAVNMGRPIASVVPVGKLVTAMAYALDANGNVVEVPTFVDAPTQAQVDAAIDAANVDGVLSNPRFAKLLFQMVNAIRVLQGNQPITAAQFRNYVASL